METYKRILSYAKPLGRYWPPYLLLSFLSVIFGIANYALIGPVLSMLFEPEKAASATSAPEGSFSLQYVEQAVNHCLNGIVASNGFLTGLLLVCLALVAATLLSNICRYLSQRILVSMKTGLMYNLRADLFQKISSLDLGYFNSRRKGDILSSISNDVSEVQNTIAGSFHIFFREPLLVIGFLAALFFMSPKLTVVSLIALPLSAIVISRITGRLRRDAVETQTLMGRILSHFEEAISGSRIIKAFNAAKYVDSQFDKDNEAHRRISLAVSNRQVLASPVSEFLGITVAAIVLLYGGWLNYRGQLGMSWSAFVVYIGFYWRVLEPAKAMASSYAAIQKGLVSAGRIFDILDAENDIKESEKPVVLDGFSKAIEFRGVSFSYGSEPVLEDIDLTIPKGRTVAIVGPSGAGKSTLADLIPRFWDCVSGEILIDGHDIRTLSIASLRSIMGIVTQEPILFNDSIFGNITFGMEGVSSKQVEEAAAIANADEFISRMEKGYQTNIGDRGAKLSGGQRQRIAIARAVLKNPPFLILDEATSSLDTESERLVQDALTKLMSNRTCLVIAHRLSTIRHADEIIVLQKGRIAERGTHEQLIKAAGLYSHLCELQAFS